MVERSQSHDGGEVRFPDSDQRISFNFSSSVTVPSVVRHTLIVLYVLYSTSSAHSPRNCILHHSEVTETNVHRLQIQNSGVLSSWESGGGGSSLILLKPSHVPAAPAPNPAKVATSEGAAIVAPRD